MILYYYFFAVITYFRKIFITLLKIKDLFFKILISSLPVMMAGYLLIKFNLVEHLRNIKIIGWSTLIFGIILYLSDKSEVKNQIESNFTIRSALVIGFFKILSLIYLE